MKKILLTSTSFQDTPGKHQELLNQLNFEVDNLRGPLKEKDLLEILKYYDGIICGDDEITEAVIKNGSTGKLKVISKYGIGLDKIDIAAAKKYNIPVTNCPGVNHVTVAEHVMALMLSFYKNIHLEHNITQKGGWKRLIGHEVQGKRIGIFGLGRIGKELAKRANAFGMEVWACDKFMDHEFAKLHSIQVVNTIEELCSKVDILSLHTFLDQSTREIVSQKLVEESFKQNLLLINTSRGELINLNAVVSGLENKILSGYLTDVLEEEPMKGNHPLLKFDNVIITPHIGSRTFQSVERQGTMALENLLLHLKPD